MTWTWLLICFTLYYILGLPCGSAGKESACNAGDLGSIPGLGRCPGEGKGSPLQCSGLENSVVCNIHGAAKSLTWLSNFDSLTHSLTTTLKREGNTGISEIVVHTVKLTRNLPSTLMYFIWEIVVHRVKLTSNPPSTLMSFIWETVVQRVKVTSNPPSTLMYFSFSTD